MNEKEIVLGINPTRSRVMTMAQAQKLNKTLSASADPKVADLGDFLSDCIYGLPETTQVTVRTDTTHARLIVDALGGKKNGKV